MVSTVRNCNLLIVGGGPAGTGLLFKALKEGEFNNLCNKGMVIVEKTSNLIVGNLTSYYVNSDTQADVFLECLEGNAEKVLDIGSLEKEIEKIKSYKGRSIPLPYLQDYFKKLGKLLLERINNHPKCKVYLESCVEKIIIKKDGNFEVHINESNHRTLHTSKHVVMATGGAPSIKKNYHFNYNESIPLDKYYNKTIHSDTLIKNRLSDNELLNLKSNSSVVILGGGHSGFSSAHFLLNKLGNLSFSKGAIKIYGNSPAKIYFSSKEEALKSNYFDFDENDFCKVTKRLYRLAGLRMDGRSLYMRMKGMIKGETEERVKYSFEIESKQEFIDDIESSSLVIQALGYSFNILPVFDENGNLLDFKGKENGRWVNDLCQLLVSNNEAVSNLYAQGLATGFIPSGSLGGEPSFRGQTNGIWYYQNLLSEIILNQVLK